MLKALLAEILFGSIGVGILTYVRSGNSAVVSGRFREMVTSENRLNNFLESNREELDNADWLSIGYIPVAMNTSDGLTKSTTGAKLRRLLNGDISQIETKIKKRD